MKKKYRHLSNEERFVIETLWKKGVVIREIGRLLERSPNTVSREIEKNSVGGVYVAKKATTKAYFKRYRSKRQCLKVVMDDTLHRFVDAKLREKWSPEQISGYLKKEIGIVCSEKAVYKFARKRCYDRYLFWGWNRKRGGPKSGKTMTAKDGRVYIDGRPPLSGIGHLELDFIVSAKSSWVLLVAVDRLTKKTRVVKLHNRKRATVRGALSFLFRDEIVRSITTDNDIAFACWREIETLLNTQVYFTHPYHSWEKGLVENTNRWIRCFVAKGREIGSVTEKELWETHSFLNDRPRKLIGFQTPNMYHYQLTSSN